MLTGVDIAWAMREGHDIRKHVDGSMLHVAADLLGILFASSPTGAGGLGLRGVGSCDWD